MNAWLTTHYPHPDPDNHPWHIYLQRAHKNAVHRVEIGDRVFFYEYREQKPIKGEPRYPLGRQGIVRIATVCGPLYSRPTEIHYSDGTIGHWNWGVPTDNVDTNGFVARRDVLDVLGYKRGSYLRGFNAGTGIMRLDEERSGKLMQLFKAGMARSF